MKILSLDGGGVFGVGQALVLSGLDNTKWDAVCGTSIGSAVAAFIATGKPVNVSFFQQHMPEIFSNSWYRNPVFGPRYSDKALNAILSKTFEGTLLKDVRIPLFITACSVQGHSPKVFSSLNVEDGSMLLSDAIRASCAAPTYFKPWQGYTDGGIFTNNPALVAVTSASRELGVNLEEIELCSIGTGTFSRSENATGKGLFYWGNWLINALLEGGSDKMFDQMVESLPLGHYERYQFVKRYYWTIDSIHDMNEAIADWTKPALGYMLDIKHGILSHETEDIIKLDPSEEQQFDEAMK